MSTIPRLYPKTKGFAKGDRVELHPATDWWMRGAKYGTVTRVGKEYVHVALDKRPGRQPIPIRPQNLIWIENGTPI